MHGEMHTGAYHHAYIIEKESPPAGGDSAPFLGRAAGRPHRGADENGEK